MQTIILNGIAIVIVGLAIFFAARGVCKKITQAKNSKQDKCGGCAGSCATKSNCCC